MSVKNTFLTGLIAMSFFSNRYPEITQKYAFFIPPCRSHLYGIIFIFFPSTFRDYTKKKERKKDGFFEMQSEMDTSTETGTDW